MTLLGFHRPCHRHALAHTARGLGARARAWVWAVVALLVLATLAPAISRTLDHGRPLAERGWTEVCSARGQAWVRIDAGQGDVRGDGPAGDADVLHHLDACGYCVLATGRGTPPPCFDGWGLAAMAPATCPGWAGHALQTAPSHTPLARGPPVSS